MHRTNANFAVGVNCPVSMELMVLRDTPTIAASCACDKPLSARISFSLFLSTKLSFISLPDQAHKKHSEKKHRHCELQQGKNQMRYFPESKILNQLICSVHRSIHSPDLRGHAPSEVPFQSNDKGTDNPANQKCHPSACGKCIPFSLVQFFVFSSASLQNFFLVHRNASFLPSTLVITI